MTATPGLAVVVPTWDGLPMLERCLGALKAQTRAPDLVVVVDNGSTDGTVARLADAWPEVVVVPLSTNTGFAGGCNRGVQAVPEDMDVVLLNNDALPGPDWLSVLISARDAAPGRVGIFASKIIGPDGRIETTGDFISRSGVVVQRGAGEVDSGQYDDHTDIFSACAGASLYRREVLSSLHGFDERFFAYYEDVDLSFRARNAGWEVQLVPRARVQHAGSATSKRIPGFKRFHATRNLWWLLVKNSPPGVLPWLVLRSAGHQVIWLAGALRHRELGVSLRAHGEAFRRFPELARARRGARFLSAAELRSYLA